ncbi:GPP34 family phosphoprotein [Streptomyces sp. M41(2017)]|uniref:GPP34 family phosphoprotein n=1 Tax=Streptomyces sp. M41(2017) TaxID=1955065 RepID=UPI0009BCE14E|nr:GPP34 family phosphoprotein [Streptomyces sp. M41(2017)]OQQ13329.1 GPP34 family phosphoprotein [Streptomyces sp. M41(2017)]
MSMPRDLLIVALDVEGNRPVRSGEVSLALAGAELLALPESRAIRLEGDRIVPGDLTAPTDPLLKDAAASVVVTEPYESVDDWLWRRGEGLAATYRAAFESEGLVRKQGRRPFRGGHTVLVDSIPRRQAAEHWSAAEPVLRTLAEGIGITGETAGEAPVIEDDAAETVLAGVSGALQELEAERQRRSIEGAAFDNIWRSPE